jgi:hypothetical protein
VGRAFKLKTLFRKETTVRTRLRNEGLVILRWSGFGSSLLMMKGIRD